MTNDPESRMRAVVAASPGSPDVLEMQEVPRPEPGPGQARVQVAFCALNPLDKLARASEIAWNAPGFPFVPGYEYSGRVDAVGEGADPGLVGRRVISSGNWGGCADYAIAPADRLTEIPEGFEWHTGTIFLSTVYTAWHVLHTAGRLREGDNVLLHGAGGAIGTVAAQIAKEAGATVIGLCGSEKKIEFARGFGADHLLSYADDDWVGRVLELTGGHGADLIVDGVAGPHAARNYEAAALLGHVIYIGAVAGSPPPVDISRQLYTKSVSVQGFVVYHAMAASRGAEKPVIHQALREGRWKLPITEVVPLETTAELHRRFEAHDILGRALIEVGGEI